MLETRETLDYRPAVSTPTQRLADLMLGENGPLERFVRDRRGQDPPQPWRYISRDLRDLTDGQVDITEQSLRTWFRDPPEAEAVAG